MEATAKDPIHKFSTKPIKDMNDKEIKELMVKIYRDVALSESPKKVVRKY